VAVFRNAESNDLLMRLSNPNENGAPRVLLVVNRMAGWWKVLLPVRPNGTTGWVRATDVTITTTGYRIEVARRAHRLHVYNLNKMIENEPIAIGTADTPTPGGRYYLTELLQPPDPNGPYGPYAYGLSGYSTTLRSFAGRSPVIGIHGTNQPQLLGHDVSHGCIRMSNAAITRLSRILPLGTPVDINP
jgi:lipoprotein-anchoring transpeptidase ErfK/SrfK